MSNLTIGTITPRYVWIGQRVAEIQAMISKYQAALQPYPVCWDTELNTLLTSFATEETRDEVLKAAQTLVRVDEGNPFGLKLRIAATCESLEEAHRVAAELFLCCIAAVGKSPKGEKYLRPTVTRDDSVFAYIVIVCDW